MRALVLGPRFHRITSSLSVIVLPTAGRPEVTHKSAKQWCEVWNTGHDILHEDFVLEAPIRFGKFAFSHVVPGGRFYLPRC